MKYQFDYFEIELLGNGKAKVFPFGSKNSKEYEILVKDKNRLRKLFLPKNAQNIKDIILKRAFSRIHITVFEKEDNWYKFVASGISYDWLIHNRYNKYAYVTETIYQRAINAIESLSSKQGA